MSTSQKVLLSVLVLITVLFVASVATGSRTGDGGADSGKHGPVALLHKLTGDAGQVPRKDVSPSPCSMGGDGVLTVKGTCVLHVAKSAGATRQLKLKAGGSPLKVTAPVPKQDYSADKDVDAGAEVDVAVGADGADVTVACAGVQQCPVTVLEGS
jgi:hypothetical protein